MSGKRFLSLLLITVGLAAIPATAQQGLHYHVKVLRDKNIESTTEGIINYLNEVSPTPEMLKNIDALIQQLGAESYKDRRKAQKQLAAMGHLARAKVKAATQSNDPEIRERSVRLLHSLAYNQNTKILIACIVLLEARGPNSSAVAALLKAGPLIDSSYLNATAERSLMKISRPADLKLLLKTAGDPDAPGRRLAVIAAGQLLGQEQISQLYPLLKDDSDPEFALTVARAIANAGDRKAIPVFLTLMQHERAEVRQRSHMLLLQFTRAAIPFSSYAPVGKRTEDLAKWQQWYKTKGAKAKLHFPLMYNDGSSYLNGHMLIAKGNGGGGVAELDLQHKQVWSYPYQDCWTAQKLPNGNYLIGSHSQERLIEVTPDKKVVWDYPTRAMNAELLANGNILVASHTSQTVIEINRQTKKVVWQYDTGAECYRAYRLPNGNTVVASLGSIREVTPEKKVVWEYGEGQYFYGLQLLPDGNLVVADHNGSVYELNRKKEKLWEIKRGSATGAFKLQNGNVLVTFGSSVEEITQKGVTVWKYQGNNYGFAHK